MRAGHAEVDITPEPGMTLCGFAARRNQPSQGVDDALSVHALALEEEGRIVLLLAFDLLALGEELTLRIKAAIDAMGIPGLSSRDAVLCCTHTHSAPAAIELLGCGICEMSYWERLIRAAATAARGAVEKLQPARLRHAVVRVPGASYNRRSLLADGRVVMAMTPDAPVVRTGPNPEKVLLVRLERPDGTGIAGIVSFAAHACVMCTQNISADYPGELRRRLSERYRLPFMFLQGAGANVNLPFAKMTRQEMLQDVDRLAGPLQDVAWSPPQPIGPVSLVSTSVALSYQPLPPRDEFAAFRDGMRSIAQTGRGSEPARKALADILNVEAGKEPDESSLRYIAGILDTWSTHWLEDSRRTSGYVGRGCEVAIHALSLGGTPNPDVRRDTSGLALGFVAAEAFVETGMAVEAALPGRLVSVVGYASPLVGYLPTDEALREGGYEVDAAYRFYNRPAPFAEGSEPAVVRALVSAIRSATGET